MVALPEGNSFIPRLIAAGLVYYAVFVTANVRHQPLYPLVAVIKLVLDVDGVVPLNVENVHIALEQHIQHVPVVVHPLSAVKKLHRLLRG